MPPPLDSFGARATLDVGDRRFDIFRLDALQRQAPATSRACRSR